jgi:hypothetical protein
LQCIPVSAAGVLEGLDLLIHFLGRRRRGGVRLFPARLDLVTRFLFSGGDTILDALGADRHFGELFGERLCHG